MPFDWAAFTRRHNIQVKERGKSTYKGNIYVRCPWCGDEKMMMGLDLRTGYFACWRNPKGHGGKDPKKLIRAILRCSDEQAQAEVGVEAATATDLDAALTKLKAGDKPSADELKLVEYPHGQIVKIVDSSRPPFSWHVDYVRGRGFPEPMRVIDYYKLMAGVSGLWASRIVMPLTIDHKMYGWTGRAISKNAELRYLSFPAGGGSVSKLVFNYDNARRGGKTLVGVEGPWDAVKLDWFGRKLGVRAVAMLGLNMTSHKIDLLTRLFDEGQFEDFVIMMDGAALNRSVEFTSVIPHLRPKVKVLPDTVKDPGELTERLIERMFPVAI